MGGGVIAHPYVTLGIIPTYSPLLSSPPVFRTSRKWTPRAGTRTSNTSYSRARPALRSDAPRSYVMVTPRLSFPAPHCQGEPDGAEGG